MSEEGGLERQSAGREAEERRAWWARFSSARAWIWIAFCALVAIDLSRAPERQWSARVILMGIDIYQATLSERMGSAGVRCRFEPTCSHYAETAIRREGALIGSAAALGRLARCGPWTPAGTVDPP